MTGYRRPEGFGAECSHGHLARSCERCDDAEELARLRAENADLRDRLDWYGERAKSLAARLAAFNEGHAGDADYVMAILTELALDAGGRAKMMEGVSE